MMHLVKIVQSQLKIRAQNSVMFAPNGQRNRKIELFRKLMIQSAA